MKTKRRETGDIGEDIACAFLRNKGFVILDRNYLKKWGEIDIVAKNKDIYHFVEVKTISRENSIRDAELGEHGVVRQDSPQNVTREKGYRPEENVHPKKLERMYRTIESYLEEKKISREKEWQIDVIAIELDKTTKEARVRFLENIV